jgi:hypothetical protein
MIWFSVNIGLSNGKHHVQGLFEQLMTDIPAFARQLSNILLHLPLVAVDPHQKYSGRGDLYSAC